MIIIKSYVSPPSLIQLVLRAVCLLFGFDESWESAKKNVLSDFKIIDKLIEYNVKN